MRNYLDLTGRIALITGASSGIGAAAAKLMSEMGAQVATPLAVALNELLQNAVEHAFVAHSDELQPEVHVLFDRQGDELSVQVKDNGSGLPADFSIDKTTSLGLSIVRGLVKSQLGGKIRMYNSGGTVVELVVPVSRAESSDLARI